MRHSVMLGTLALAASVACGTTLGDQPVDDGSDAGDPGVVSDSGGVVGSLDDGGNVAPPNVSGVGAGTGALTGLPCDVQQLLENRCIGCHAGTSPPPLLTYSDLTAPSKSFPSKTMAQVAADRIKSTTSPMPPPPAVAPDANEIMTFSAWVAAGTPMGVACTGGADGGVIADAGVATPTVCTSNKMWTGGNTGSPDMRPGGACLTCHQLLGGPSYKAAGTVYPTAHEPNDCNGKGPPPALTVVITDKNNKVTRISVNSVGNFYTGSKIAAPFHVEVTDGTKTRAMMGTLTAGDCNSCHTEKGANGAPGRIMAP